MRLGYWSGFGEGMRPYQFSIVEYLPRWMNCGGWRHLFSLPLPGDRILSFFVPQITNWQGVPEGERPNYPWTQFRRIPPCSCGACLENTQAGDR